MHATKVDFCFYLHLISWFIVSNVTVYNRICFKSEVHQHLLNINIHYLTSDKLINSGIIPSTKHPTNIAREMRITAQAPSISASVLQPFRLNFVSHIQAASHRTNTLKHKNKTQYPLLTLNERHCGALHVSTPSITLHNPKLHPQSPGSGTTRHWCSVRFI